MKIGSIIAIYFVVWWTILFAILPFGVRTQEEEGEITLGTERSAPTNRTAPGCEWSSAGSAEACGCWPP